MTIFSGGKSTAINSPRHLTIRHARRVVAQRKKAIKFSLLSVGGDAPADEGTEIEKLNPGEEKLSSYWRPGLEAGPQHRINVTQTIDATRTIDNKEKKERLVLTAEQDFFVDAPQFSLPDGSVHSTYPPAGYNDDARILPHVVLTDPHLPWERIGSPKADGNDNDNGSDAGEKPKPRNRVPWLVLLSFSQDELRLLPEDLDGDTSIFKKTSKGVIKPVKQSPTMTVNMSVGDLWATDGIMTPVTSKFGPQSMKDSRGDFIFVKPELFTSFFSTFDADGKRNVPASPDTTQYQYLSHVRKINGTGMALAGVEDTAIFSIVIGNRAGPLDNVTPTTMSVHLVSIEGVEDMTFPIQSRYVALCSLYSWNYTVNPPGMRNVPDSFEELGRTLDVLRAPDRLIEPLQSGGKVPARIAARLKDGYSLVKYRTQTGEPTVALFRGPFTPTIVRPLENLNQCSNSSVDLQILDKEVGIMDITYSVAWQVGRTLALGDEGFTAALNRHRTAIHKPAMKKAKIETVREKDENSFRSRRDVLADLPNMVNNLAAIHVDSTSPPPDNGGSEPESSFNPGGPKKRWFRHRLARNEIPGLTFTSLSIEEKYPETSVAAARKLAMGTDGSIFDETNDPLSSDWMIIQSWLLNLMFLSGVPAHYLIADPSYLEHESLRFFYIDPNWVDALIDGALSLGNHYGTDKDRVAIKQALNDYVKNTPEHMDHAPQIPTYGFYLRSDLVTMFPDLRVTLLPERSVNSTDRTPLLRHEIVADGVMMGLLDRVPGSEEFTGLVFTQPPHQQRFAVSRGLTAERIKVDIRRQYTVDLPTREGLDDWRDRESKDRLKALTEVVQDPTTTDSVFVWGSEPGLKDLRIMRLPKFAELQKDTLMSLMRKYEVGGEQHPYFFDDTATSALFAMQLNDPIYNLTIKLKDSGGTPALASLSPPPDAGPELRTLSRLQPFVVRKFREQEDSSGDGDGPDGESDDEATFERHEDYTGGIQSSANFAPHVRAIPTVDWTPTPSARASPTAAAPEAAPPATHPAPALRAVAMATTPSPGPSPGPSVRVNITKEIDSRPASAPKFDIVISSNTREHTNVIKVGDPNLAQDLIFSIRVKENQSNQYKLVELDLQIPLGNPAKTTNDDIYLMQTYDGPGCHMLTNLRFNVLAMFPTIAGVKYFRLRVLPRSSKGWIDMTTVKDMSFLLGLVKVNTPPGRIVQFDVEAWAEYCRDALNPRIDKENLVQIPVKMPLQTIVNSSFPAGS